MAAAVCAFPLLILMVQVHVCCVHVLSPTLKAYMKGLLTPLCREMYQLRPGCHMYHNLFCSGNYHPWLVHRSTSVILSHTSYKLYDMPKNMVTEQQKDTLDHRLPKKNYSAVDNEKFFPATMGQENVPQARCCSYAGAQHTSHLHCRNLASDPYYPW